MKKLYDFIGKAEVSVSAFCFASSCLVIFVAAIARTLRQPINWSQDLSLFLFTWSVFLSADVALRADKLVSIDLLVKGFSARTKKIIAVITYIIIFAFLAALFIYGIKLSLFSRRRVFQGIPGFSYSWVTLSVVVGSLLQMATVILKLKKMLFRNKPEIEKSEA